MEKKYRFNRSNLHRIDWNPSEVRMRNYYLFSIFFNYHYALPNKLNKKIIGNKKKCNLLINFITDNILVLYQIIIKSDKIIKILNFLIKFMEKRFSKVSSYYL